MQACTSHTVIESALAGTSNGAVRHDSPEQSELRCQFPQCQKPSFKKLKDLKRHEKKHDPNAVLWRCGCCQNMGHPFKLQIRKDKVLSHLRNIHERSKSEDSRALSCPVASCHTLLTAASCLVVHLKQEHPDYARENPNHAISSEYIIPGRKCEPNLVAPQLAHVTAVKEHSQVPFRTSTQEEATSTGQDHPWDRRRNGKSIVVEHHNPWN